MTAPNAPVALPAGSVPFQSVAILFADQARRTPETVALRLGARTLSYRALEAASRRLALDLLRRGLEPQTPVALLLPRGFEQVIGLLAILRAGGAYVPLDPSYPAARLEAMLRDCGAPLLLTAPGLAVPGDFAGTTVLMPAEQAGLAVSEPEALPTVAPGPDALAYVLYTSGSTGAPKGVEGTHRSLAARALGEPLPFAPDEVLCQKTSISFIDSLWEIFAALTRGLSAVIVPHEQVADPTALVEELAAHGVTRLVLVPSLLAALLDVEGDLAARLPRLRIWISSGEALPADLCRRFHERLPGRTLVNLYGTSEVWDATWLDTAEVAGERAVPIGRPLEGMQVALLDPALQPVTEGEVGELAVAGPTLARGYRGDPERTAQRFVSPPFAGEVRFYRTGDLGRRRADGVYEYLGRLDRQVKIRGVRIEVDEIEVAVRALPGVAGAAVVARADPSGAQRLVAYVAGEQLAERDLRAHLKARLPRAMLPYAYVFLPTLPLTPNGKTDHRALPPPRWQARGTGQDGTPARTPTEKAVAEVWAEVLEVDAVGRDDDWFELGGDSLSAARAMVRLGDGLGRELHARALFAHPTVARLAAWLDGAQPEAAAGAPAASRLLRDALLDPALRPGPGELPAAEPREILLTGATGFLGAYLLDALLRHTDARVHCLVRADGAAQAESRLRQALAKRQLAPPGLASRVVALPGDLAQPRLGLSAERFAALADDLDAILHNGAHVHFVYGYEQLAPTNVEGTREALRLACQGRRKRFHFVSTLAAVDSPGHFGRRVPEAPLADPSDLPLTGYAQSKWVAERLVVEAGARGLPVSVYRSDDISGQSATGDWNPTDFIWLWLKGCVQLGVAPDIDVPEYMVPVDVISAAVVHLLRQRPAAPAGGARFFHLCNPEPIGWPELVRLVDGLGHPMRLVPFREFQERLRTLHRSDPENALCPLTSLFTEPVDSAGRTLIEVYARGSRPDYDDAQTREGLRGAGLALRRVDAALMRVYLEAFARARFLPAPGQRAAW